MVVGLPFAAQIILNVRLITSGQSYEGAESAFPGLILILSLLAYYGWIGAVGISFSKRNTATVMPIARFRYSIWTSFVSTIFLFIYFWVYPNFSPEVGVIPVMMIGVLVFIALFTLLYSLSFMARSIVQLERKRRVNTSEFYNEFVMAVIFPIGIWLLQPRINRLNQTL